MRLTTNTNVSVDGVMQGLGGPEEDRSGGFERGGWATPLFGNKAMTLLSQVYRRADEFLFGRRTYESFAGSWGELEDPGINPIAERRGRGKICGSECHALLPARRVADHADLRYRLGRGQVLGPHPGGRTPGVQRP